MIKRIILSLAMLVLAFKSDNLNAQNYITYTKHISEISTLILHKQYPQALALFSDSISPHYNFIYAHDIFMATQLAIHTKQIDIAFEYLEKCARQGIPLQLLKNDYLISKLIVYPRWKDFEHNYALFYAEYAGKINLTIRKKIDSLATINDEANERLDRYQFEKRWIYLPAWRKKINSNAITLLKIISENGFPGEKMIGITSLLPADTLVSSKRVIGMDRTLGSFNAYDMLSSYFTSKKDSLNGLLWPSVLNGLLSVKDYASLIDLNATSNTKYSNHYYNEARNDPDYNHLAEINTRRLALGLYTYENKLLLYKRFVETRNRVLDTDQIYIEFYH